MMAYYYDGGNRRRNNGVEVLRIFKTSGPQHHRLTHDDDVEQRLQIRYLGGWKDAVGRSTK